MFYSLDGIAGSIGTDHSPRFPNTLLIEFTSINHQPSPEVAERMCRDVLRLSKNVERCGTFGEPQIDVDVGTKMPCP